MAWYFECPIQRFSAAFDVLIKISESYRPQIPSETQQEGNFANESCHLAEDEPIYVKDALKNPDWKSAMDEEIKSIKKNETWKLVSPPKDYKHIGLKWVLKIKIDQNDQILKYKARLVVKRYT